MLPLFAQRLGGWLSVALALVWGLAPVHAFVLCVEADGCITLEVRGAEPCEGCPPHVERGDTATDRGRDDGDCVDVALPVATQQQKTTVNLDLSPPAPALVPDCAERGPSIEGDSLASPAPRDGPVRPPDALARLRTVVLLV